MPRQLLRTHVAVVLQEPAHQARAGVVFVAAGWGANLPLPPHTHTPDGGPGEALRGWSGRHSGRWATHRPLQHRAGVHGRWGTELGLRAWCPDLTMLRFWRPCGPEVR